MKKCALGMIIYLFGTASGAWSDTYTHSILDIESFVFEGVDFEIACGVENQVVVKAKSEDDFELITIDLVAKPSHALAYLQPHLGKVTA